MEEHQNQSFDEHISRVDDKETQPPEVETTLPPRSVIRVSSSAANRIPGWRLVEVVGMVDGAAMESGGAFLLRDETGSPVLARAFPVAASHRLLAEGVALREAVRAMAGLGEERVLFCCSYPKLLRCLLGGLPRAEASEVDAVSERVVEQCQDSATCVAESRFVYRPRGKMRRVLWLAEVGARSLQHMQWDAPFMEEIGYI